MPSRGVQETKVSLTSHTKILFDAILGDPNRTAHYHTLGLGDVSNKFSSLVNNYGALWI
jgi:hypothetical protein